VNIGDLVKYDKSLSGLHNCLGLVVGFNGQAIVVLWIDRASSTGAEKSVEMPEFLEVVSKT
jgi:hypothetical protein